MHPTSPAALQVFPRPSEERSLHPAGQDERLLIARFRHQADPTAFEALYREALPAVRRVAARHRIPNRQIDDLAQEVYVTVLEALDRFDGSRPFAAWVSGITRRLILRQRRRFCQRQVTEWEAPPDEPSALETLVRQEARSGVASALRLLPPNYREVLELRFVSGLTPQEIGRKLGTKPSTIRTRLARGQAILRQSMPADAATPS